MKIIYIYCGLLPKYFSIMASEELETKLQESPTNAQRSRKQKFPQRTCPTLKCDGNGPKCKRIKTISDSQQNDLNDQQLPHSSTTSSPASKGEGDTN